MSCKQAVVKFGAAAVEGLPDALDAGARYSTPSGSSASRLAMYSRRASSTASSIGGGS